MSGRRLTMRVRVDEGGGIEVIDPGFDTLPLLQAVDPEFRIRSAPLSGFTASRLRQALRTGCGVLADRLRDETETELWDLHAVSVERLHSQSQGSELGEGEASILALKIELARRMLSPCRLCSHRCEVDRARGELGRCRLGLSAIVAEQMVHIAEESPINPCLLLNLAGCGLRCRFCQQSDLLDPASVEGAPLDAPLWDTLDATGARSMAFAGGNPDESLYAILQFLATAPADWMLPIVWNCHGAATLETVALLDGVVDVYLPDFKYGADLCGRQLSGIPDYPETAQAAVAAMLAQGVPVIVRLLVLPGHGSCCHLPVLERLASLPGTCLVSVRAQYCPDFRVTPADGMMARRPTWEEVEVVREKARQCGLRIIE